MLDAFNKVQKSAMFLLETLVELLGDFLDIKGRPHSARYINDSQIVLFVQCEDKLLQLLDQPFPGFSRVIGFRAWPVGLAGFALDPLPVLHAPVGRGVDDQVFTDGLGNGLFDFLTGGMVREGVVRISDVLVDNQAAFVDEGFEHERLACDGNFYVLAAVVPAKLFDEQGAEVTVLQVASDFFSVEGCRHVEEELEQARVGQAGHFAVQRQDVQVGPGIVVGNETVEQTGTARRLQGLDDGPPVERGDQTAGQGF